MIRASYFLFRTLATTRAGSAATRSGSVASFAVPNRFLQTAHYGSSTAAGARTPVVGWFFGILGATVVVIDFTVGPPPFHDYTNDTVLYQCETCPISTQVRVFLDYYDIPYKVIEVNPISKKEIKWSEYRDLPILIVDGKQLNGSSAIIDRLGQKILSKQNTDSTSEDGEETKWQKWADNRLVHLLEPNIYRTASEALESLDYITSNGNYNSAEKIVKYVGAATFHFMFNSVKQKYNIADERAALYEAAETWVVALNGQEFLGGSKPNLADMAVFGVLRPIRYLRCGKDMVEHTRIGEWYTRMENAVGKSSRIEV